MITLSEQELVNCDRSQNPGCNGGLMDYAFQCIVSNGSMDTKDDYPYRGVDGQNYFSLISKWEDFNKLCAVSPFLVGMLLLSSDCDAGTSRDD
ncbi:cathepsin L [Salvia divinorum]|uniref:Cathepsin L n=1 Tax=Salvia divinorum TaxID=28513 RepID=A0ABD1G9Z7_SALDI